MKGKLVIGLLTASERAAGALGMYGAMNGQDYSDLATQSGGVGRQRDVPGDSGASVHAS